jgi:hypothetical protein
MTLFLLLLILGLFPLTRPWTARSAAKGSARTVTALAERGQHAAEQKAVRSAGGRSSRARGTGPEPPPGMFPLDFLFFALKTKRLT